MPNFHEIWWNDVALAKEDFLKILVKNSVAFRATASECCVWKSQKDSGAHLSYSSTIVCAAPLPHDCLIGIDTELNQSARLHVQLQLTFPRLCLSFHSEFSKMGHWQEDHLRADAAERRGTSDILDS